jgi:hypothetical protein
MADKKIINDRQRARKVYGFVQRLPDRVYNAIGAAEGTAGMLSLDWKESVSFASTGNISLPPVDPLQAIDGISNVLSDGERILLKNQYVSSENGIYVVNVAGGTWDRADDAIPGDTLTCGAVVYVEGGTSNQGTKWILSTKNVTLGGSQTWVMFEKANDWIVSGSGGQMRTPDPISIGGDFAKDIASDIFFYVSGSRRVGSPSLENSNVVLFSGDVTISGTVDMTRSDGFWGDRMEVSGSFAVTTGSISLEVAGSSNDFSFFVDEAGLMKVGRADDPYGFAQTGGAYITGSLVQGWDCNPAASWYSFGYSTIHGIRASANRFGQYSHAGSGFDPSDFTAGTQGESQYTRNVWCGQAASGDSVLNFTGYTFLGLYEGLFLEDGKSYAIRVTSIISESGDPSNCAMFVRDILAYCTAGTAVVINVNDTFTYQNGTTWDLDVTTDGFNGLVFHIDAGTGPATFSFDVKATATIEASEILAV